MATENDRPNVVYVLADDLGYGDVARYNADSQIPTPNLDRLAEEGRTFTDAHAPSAVCTPTRYSLLTGRYCWRTELDSGVLWPWDPPLIDADRLTVPELLGEHGYHTACVGKWHLGWDWPTDDGRPAGGDASIGDYASETRRERNAHVDFSEPVGSGPTERGFDYYFGDDVPNFQPYAWIEDDRVLTRPTDEKPESMFGLDGPMAPGWSLESVMPEITARAVEYVEERGEDYAEGGDPFFLYFPLTAPHTPIVPTKRFRGRSDAGLYGDWVCEVDWALGEVLDALDRTGVAEDTLVVFTSDNGPEHLDGLDDATAYDRARDHDHYSMDDLRGIKRDAWEGGHRVPFIARSPGEVPADTECGETICLVDLLRTLASLLDTDLPADAGEDSYDVLPALRGEDHETPLREATVHHSSSGNLAIRKEEWVLIDAPTGDENGEPDWFREERGYEDHDHPGELYDLSADRSQRENLYGERPEKVEELRTLLDRYRETGRSHPA
ncbi:MAG: arylsulfatase [Halobacteriales archaeon]